MTWSDQVELMLADFRTDTFKRFRAARHKRVSGMMAERMLDERRALRASIEPRSVQRWQANVCYAAMCAYAPPARLRQPSARWQADRNRQADRLYHRRSHLR